MALAITLYHSSQKDTERETEPQSARRLYVRRVTQLCSCWCPINPQEFTMAKLSAISLWKNSSVVRKVTLFAIGLSHTAFIYKWNEMMFELYKRAVFKKRSAGFTEVPADTLSVQPVTGRKRVLKRRQQPSPTQEHTHWPHHSLTCMHTACAQR